MFHRSTLDKAKQWAPVYKPELFHSSPLSLLPDPYRTVARGPALSDKNVPLELMLIIRISRIYAIHLTGRWLEKEKEKIGFSCCVSWLVGRSEWKGDSFQCNERLNSENELQLNGKTHGDCSCYTFLLSPRSGIDGKWWDDWLTGMPTSSPSIRSSANPFSEIGKPNPFKRSLNQSSATSVRRFLYCSVIPVPSSVSYISTGWRRSLPIIRNLTENAPQSHSFQGAAVRRKICRNDFQLKWANQFIILHRLRAFRICLITSSGHGQMWREIHGAPDVNATQLINKHV